MKRALRHSHIAIRETLPRLAAAAGLRIGAGEDDLGSFRFFDLEVGEGSARQSVRFAGRDGDALVHLLAERIDDVAGLTAALRQVGLDAEAELSISRDQDDQLLRDPSAIRAGLPAPRTPVPKRPATAR